MYSYLVLLNCVYINNKVFIVCFSGSKKKRRLKKKEKEIPSEAEVKQNDIEVHEEHKCDVPDEKPPAGMAYRIFLKECFILLSFDTP